MSSGKSRGAARGQVSSLDATVALTVFMLIFFAYISMSDYLSAPRLTGFNEAFTRAHRIAFTLTESDGIPSNWNASHYSKIGLADGQRMLFLESKAFQLAQLNYSQAVEELGVGEYNLRIRLLNTTGSAFNVTNGTHFASAEFGSEPANSTLVVPVKRIATMNGQTVILEVTLWKQ